MTSSRLPKKVLLPLAGEPLLKRIIERVKLVDEIEQICIASVVGKEHDPIEELCQQIEGVKVFRGSENNVFDRTLKAAEFCDAKTIIRITSDCPFIDPQIVATLLTAYQSSGVKYARLPFSHGYPLGFDAEVFDIETLKEISTETMDDYEREHATPYIWRRPERFESLYLDYFPDYRNWRLVVDTKEDYAMASRVYDDLYPLNPKFGFNDLKKYFSENPEVLAINGSVKQNEYIGTPKASN